MSLAFWQKITVLILVLSILGFVLAVFFHMRFTDVLFMEGALIFALGGYVAAGPKPVDNRTTIACPTVSRDYLLEQRPKRVSRGVVLMIVGAVLMVLGVVVGFSMTSTPFYGSLTRSL